MKNKFGFTNRFLFKLQAVPKDQTVKLLQTAQKGFEFSKAGDLYDIFFQHNLLKWINDFFEKNLTHDLST